MNNKSSNGEARDRRQEVLIKIERYFVIRNYGGQKALT